MTSLLPVLYHSGCLTIKDYDELIELYVLDIPNNEIRAGLMEIFTSKNSSGHAAD